jgi:succinyl-CoA synthetase alpha subunit
MKDAGLLNEDGEKAGPGDLIIAVRAKDVGSADAAFTEAESLIDKPATSGGERDEWRPRSLDGALKLAPDSNVALISVPGEFAANEARRALSRGLHVMMFSDNVPVEDEIDLKNEARRRGLLMMGPDCGTAIIGGTPLAFANVIARGNIGIVAASGTGLQEVSTLIARNGRGVSHAIGVGGRDLKAKVGGLMTSMAIDALQRDPDTEHIVIISKPPEKAVADAVLKQVAASKKPFSICFIGADNGAVPANAKLSADLRTTAENALGMKIEWNGPVPDPAKLAGSVSPGRKRIQGLFAGGTLCAEAQVFFQRAKLTVTSNVPIPGIDTYKKTDRGHMVLDLGDDEYTVGRPHPMIDPSLRNDMLQNALDSDDTGVVLFDVVIGYGAHTDPAGDLIAQLPKQAERKAILIASVCGTESDPQNYSQQVRALESAGIIVAPSNAHAVELAIEVAGKIG